VGILGRFTVKAELILLRPIDSSVLRFGVVLRAILPNVSETLPYRLRV